MNIYLIYLAISIIGSMLPFFEKKFLKILDVDEFLSLRWLVVIFYVFFIDVGKLYKKLIKMNTKDKGLLLLYQSHMITSFETYLPTIRIISHPQKGSNAIKTISLHRDDLSMLYYALVSETLNYFWMHS